MEFMEDEDLYAFSYIRIILFRILKWEKVRVGAASVFILHLCIAIIQSYCFAMRFQIHYFATYAPAYFVRFFLLAAMASIIEPKSGKLTHFMLEEFNMMSFRNMKSSIKSQIRRESNVVATLIVLNLLLAIFCGIVLTLPSPDDKNIFFILAFIEENCPKWNTILSWMYRCSFTYTALLMGLPIYWLMSYFWLLKFQMYVLIESIKEMKHFQNNKLLNIKVKERLKLCIIRHNEMIKCMNMWKDLLNKYVPIIFVTASLLSISLIFFIISFEGTMQHKYVRAIPFLFIVITDAFGMTVTGQMLEDEFERVVTVLQIQPWYKWNQENKKLYLIFFMNATKSRLVQFSEDMSLNYRLGAKFIKVIYSLVSVLIQRRNS